MADVVHQFKRDRSRNRGQLFLVGALSLAVTLVALALVLNSAIYTENLASRGADQTRADDALTFQRDARHGVGGLVNTANEQSSTYLDQRNAVNAGVLDLDELLSQYTVRQTTVVRVDNPVHVEGAQIEQATDGQFNSPSGTGDWTVASDVRTRQFALTATRTSLEDEADDDAFRVVFADGTDTWTVRVFRDDSTTTTIVRITDPSGGRAECRDSAGSATTVGFSDATVGGSHCRALEFFDELATPYDVRYANPTAASGTYSLVVEKAVSNLNADGDDADYSAPDPGEPTATAVIYATTVDLMYRTPDVTYEASIRVAPGEPNA